MTNTNDLYTNDKTKTFPPANGTRLTTCDIKLDGVGPVDNRPFTDKLHHYVQFFYG